MHLRCFVCVRRAEAAYSQALKELGVGLDAQPAAIHALLAPEFPQLTRQVQLSGCFHEIECKHCGVVLTACLAFFASAAECVVAPKGAPTAAEAACSYGGGRRCSTHQVDWAVRQGWGEGGIVLVVSADKK